MTTRLAINGFGRIGRCVLRALWERQLGEDLEVIGINELADLDTIAYLCRYDSTHGRFPGELETHQQQLLLDGHVIHVSHHQQMAALPWRELGVDVALECSGTFSSRKDAQTHLDAGADAVLFSQPADPDIDATIVYGVNHEQLKADDRIISAASCTTNCVAPIIKILDEALGVEAGVITTIHSAMNDQPVLDSYHHTDLRKTRAAIQSIIPVETGLARGIDRVLPALAGRFEAQAMRVPTQNVSAIDLSVQVQRNTTDVQVNDILRAAVEKQAVQILGYTEEPLASCDFNHDSRSAIVDASQTRVGGKRLVKVLLWFDNEWAYANRMLDILLYWRSLQ
ncbi:MAG: type I glyceraldehyde-3-phosphate dehydrogenase [Gammaproteobacteria bacterium]|nr:MAG: type I glyceraldehyde-3-phosphate dehydrogenase [Gammaproteobacteria bacterium]RLA48294.1 MAG: type I glyceraldehyde-3-phosphate dehydrogenase [Gammaproteobacteria bacterium]